MRHPNFPGSLRSVSLCRFFDPIKADPFLSPRHVAEVFFFVVAIRVASLCILLVERPFMRSSLHSVQSSMARILLGGRVDLRVKSDQSRLILLRGLVDSDPFRGIASSSSFISSDFIGSV